jgi:hypothetical protein
MSDEIRIETDRVRSAPRAMRPAPPTPKERSMSSVLETLDREGFTDHFTVCDERLVGIDCGETFEADEVVIRCVERFEGLSNPDDMSVVYALETCDGVRGTLTDAFGVYSDPGVSQFIDKVECHLQKARGS